MKLQGVIVPLLTPLTADERLDEASLEKLINHVLSAGAGGIFLLGSTGEFPLLGVEVKARLLGAALEIVHRRAPVLVGISEISTRQAVGMGRQAVRMGADAVVAAPPYYYRHRQSELIGHFKTLAERLDAPVALYNVPQNVKLSLEAETVRRLAEIPNIIGIKDSAGDMAVFQDFLDLRASRPGFGVVQGSELLSAVSLVRGANGLVLGLSNVAPRLCVALYDAVARGDLETAWDLQAQLRTLHPIVKLKSGFAGMKTACHLMGLCGTMICAPFEPLDREQVELVRRTLIELGLL